jgi:hypothetical protein
MSAADAREGFVVRANSWSAKGCLGASVLNRSRVLLVQPAFLGVIGRFMVDALSDLVLLWYLSCSCTQHSSLSYSAAKQLRIANSPSLESVVAPPESYGRECE